MPRGRRQRKSTSQRKNSLIFTESPLSVNYSHTSPIRCASHPATAQVVSVEELADVTWVSPQFTGPVSGRRRRGRHRAELSRSTINTRSRRQDSKENLQCSIGGRKNLPRGFIPLKLQWDQSEEVVDIQEISEAETDVELNCSRNINLQTSTIITPSRFFKENTEELRHCSSKASLKEDRLSAPDKEVVGTSEGNKCDDLLNLSTLTQLAKNSKQINPRVLFTAESESESPSMIRPHRLRPRRPARLHDKYTEAVALLRSPVVLDRVLAHDVLAPDTPESEYGIPRRQILRQKLIKQKVYPT